LTEPIQTQIQLPNKQNFTPLEVSVVLEVSVQTIYGWIARNVLPARKVGPKLMRIKREDILKMYKECE